MTFQKDRVSADDWHHLSFVYDETGAEGISYRLYLDGEKVEEIVVTNRLTIRRIPQKGSRLLPSSWLLP